MMLVVLEATRRSDGPHPATHCLAVYCLCPVRTIGPGCPRAPGRDLGRNLVNHLYLTSQGIYGIAVGVVATYVFHFVLFGVLATRVGLGELFIELALCVAGRYAGGPAKVSVFSSALFGMISGSSIANTVTTGALPFRP